MIFFPAIDLKDGNCVRLYQGDMDKATVFGTDPAAQARIFVDAGARWLHVVDLNGAFAGRPVNAGAVQAIVAAIDIPMQLGGGIRDMATVDFWLENGVSRVILGTAALKNPGLVKDACRAHPGRVAVGIDAKDGRVATEGWADVSDVAVADLARRFEGAGVAALIHTDIARDGAMRGPNVQASVALAETVSIPVIVSGGVSSMADLEAVRQASKKAKRPLEGVISGRAVYDGRIDLPAAVKLLEAA